MKKDSVALITFHSWINGDLNYGATLQAYALCTTIGAVGYDVELVNYHPEVVPAKGMCKMLYRRLFRYALSMKVPRRKRQGFERFLIKHCPLGEHEYKSFKELLANPPTANIYVAGSDQIWNPDIFHGTLYPAYYLNFGKPETKRIAYASSFGSIQIELSFMDEMGEYLSRFSSIAVREESGSAILKKLLKNNASIPAVLDPTLLVPDYEEVLMPMDTKGMLLAYLFDPTDDDISCLKNTSRALGLRPAIIGDERMSEYEGVQLVACYSPSEWVGALNGADGVVTNSFHGTAFAVMFEKPFVSLLSKKGGVESRNTRVQNLAAKLNVEHALTEERNSEIWVALLRQSGDWPAVRNNLSKERAKSIEYLTNALGG